MNVNKKFDRFKQWGRERLGADGSKTDLGDEFRSLETEMTLRNDGMDRLGQCSNAYIKSLSRRDQGEGKEKQLPIGYFGNTLASHGDDFEPDSEFGQCLGQLGRANERLARVQETYVANATSSWLESVERSQIQMKEYQKAKAKLESRRLAYDTAQRNVQKMKKEDFRAEEELRSQKAKYEESSEDVYRRMLDIKEAEADSIADLSSFLEAELTYYDRCREVLLQVKREWPAATAPSRSDTTSPVNGLARRGTRSRSNTASSFTAGGFPRISEEPVIEAPARISSRLPSGQNSPRRELPGFDLQMPSRPTVGRTNSNFEGPSARDVSPAGGMARLSRVPTADSVSISAARLNLRNTQAPASQYGGSSGGNIFDDDSHSEAHSDGSDFMPSNQRRQSWVDGRKPPPPPPPSRAKKPPPPPPLKRSALSESQVSQY
ncbi:hypothetical protein LTR95_008116 [Oleoguttula sp. CCFEE 5521]